MCQPAAGGVRRAAPRSPTTRRPLKAYWESGVWFASANDEFKVHFGGRIQFDAFNDFDVQRE